MSTYIIDGGSAGRERLRLLAETMAPLTEPMLDRLAITGGMRCLDAGCGGGDVARSMARRCGPSGTVEAIDIDATVIDLAAAEPLTAGTAPVVFRVGDVRTMERHPRFDIIYARFLLSHLPDPAATIDHCIAMLRPGGVLAIEDVWFPGHYCWPAHEAFDTFVDWYRQAARRRGADADIGIKLPAMVEEAGLVDVRHHMQTQAFREGRAKGLTMVTLERIRTAVLGAGITDAKTFDDVANSLRSITNDTTTMVSMAPVMQVTGRLPVEHI